MGAAVALESAPLLMPGSFHDAALDMLRHLADAAAGAVDRAAEAIQRGEIPARTALLSRVRGTGPGVSLRLVSRTIEVVHPVPLKTPFEGAASVAGAVLDLRELVARDRDDAFLRLRFAAGATDLPMHVHEESDRFILVVRGRGFFHVTAEPLEAFTGESIRTVAVRERDALLFLRGTMHTFSTTTQALHLLSYQAPYIPLDDPRQYTLPGRIVCPGLSLEAGQSAIALDAAWTVLV